MVIYQYTLYTVLISSNKLSSISDVFSLPSNLSYIDLRLGLLLSNKESAFMECYTDFPAQGLELDPCPKYSLVRFQFVEHYQSVKEEVANSLSGNCNQQYLRGELSYPDIISRDTGIEMESPTSAKVE